jgi:hypothetical protein
MHVSAAGVRNLYSALTERRIDLEDWVSDEKELKETCHEHGLGAETFLRADIKSRHVLLRSSSHGTRIMPHQIS